MGSTNQPDGGLQKKHGGLTAAAKIFGERYQ
jgi:hypothetical protein